MPSLFKCDPNMLFISLLEDYKQRSFNKRSKKKNEFTVVCVHTPRQTFPRLHSVHKYQQQGFVTL